MNGRTKTYFAAIIILFLNFYCKGQVECPQPTDSSFKPYYTKLALKKVEDLGDRISLISDKTTPPLEASNLIDLAIQSFINEDAIVHVSNINDITRDTEYKIREYLRRIKALKYDKVDLVWASIKYISDLRYADNGNYYGVISYEQKFVGIRDGKVMYEDWVEKHAEVILKRIDVDISGGTLDCWDVLLGDINVKNTYLK